jgi:hypothetical protein
MDKQQNETCHVWTANLGTERPVIFISRFTDESGHVSTVCKYIDSKYLCQRHPIVATLNYPDEDHIAFLQACQLSIFKINRASQQSSNQGQEWEVPSIDHVVSASLYGRDFHDHDEIISTTRRYSKVYTLKLHKSISVADATVYRGSLYVLLYITKTITEYIDEGDEFDELISGKVLKGSKQLVLDRIDMRNDYKYVAMSMTVTPKTVDSDQVLWIPSLFNGFDDDCEVLVYVKSREKGTQKDVGSKIYIIDHDRFSIKRVLRRKVCSST